jgi:phosphoribosylanthranilate isomerase
MSQPLPSTGGEIDLNRAFQIKICGVTSVADALAAVDAGADAIGLNFYPRSPRFVDAATAMAISRAIGATALKVGVFVDRPPAELIELMHDCRLDAAQLHGDEPPAYLAQLADIKIIRALRPAASLTPVEQYLDACAAGGRTPWMTLIDAAAPGEFGGTGKLADWKTLAARTGALAQARLVLAGGLTPQNVGEAIRIVRPTAVDVASGVESAPGRKSPERMRAFVAAAREAFRQPG